MTRTKIFSIIAVIAAALVLIFALPTAARASTHNASAWSWCSSDPEGTWQIPGGPDGTDYFVQNDMWNGSAGPQTICANSFSDVRVTSNQPPGNTEIETYPDVGGLYTGADTPVSSFKAIYNHFSENFPSDVIGEAADDVWLNNWSIEIMIWTDTHNEDLSWLPVMGTATIYGQTFKVYDNAPEYIFKLDGNETSGTTHILSAIHWLEKHGAVPANPGVTEAEFGWEVAGTNGPEQFNLTSYKLYAPKAS